MLIWRATLRTDQESDPARCNFLILSDSMCLVRYELSVFQEMWKLYHLSAIDSCTDINQKQHCTGIGPYHAEYYLCTTILLNFRLINRRDPVFSMFSY